MNNYDMQANQDVFNELRDVDLFFKNKVEIDPEEYIVTHELRKAIKIINASEDSTWFEWLRKFKNQITSVDGCYYSDVHEDLLKIEKTCGYRGKFSFYFNDSREKDIFETNMDAIFSIVQGEVQLISGRNASFFESCIKALKLGAIPYDFQDGKIVVCVPKENYVPVSKPDERIIIDVSYQDDDFDMATTRDNYEASFDNEAFKKANVGDVFTMGKIAGEDVEWRVLDVDSSDGSKLVITKDVIDVKRAIELEGISNMRSIAWKETGLREWLNTKFMDAIIPTDIHSNIKEITIQNKGFMPPLEYNNQDFSNNDSMDKIFILSMDEASKYFDSDSDRIAYASDYVWKRINPYLYRHSKNEKTGGIKWWLRDTNIGGSASHYNVVDGDGSISDYQLISYAEEEENKSEEENKPETAP